MHHGWSTNRLCFVQSQCVGTLSPMKVTKWMIQTCLLFIFSSFCLRSASFASCSSVMFVWSTTCAKRRSSPPIISSVRITMLLFWVSFRYCLAPGVLKTFLPLDCKAKWFLFVISPCVLTIQFAQSWIQMFEKHDTRHRPVSAAGWVVLEWLWGEGYEKACTYLGIVNMFND